MPRHVGEVLEKYKAQFAKISKEHEEQIRNDPDMAGYFAAPASTTQSPMETNEAESSRRRINTDALASGSRPAKQSRVVSSSGLPTEAGGTSIRQLQVKLLKQ